MHAKLLHQFTVLKFKMSSYVRISHLTLCPRKGKETLAHLNLYSNSSSCLINKANYHFILYSAFTRPLKLLCGLFLYLLFRFIITPSILVKKNKNRSMLHFSNRFEMCITISFIFKSMSAPYIFFGFLQMENIRL